MVEVNQVIVHVELSDEEHHLGATLVDFETPENDDLHLWCNSLEALDDMIETLTKLRDAVKRVESSQVILEEETVGKWVEFDGDYSKLKFGQAVKVSLPSNYGYSEYVGESTVHCVEAQDEGMPLQLPGRPGRTATWWLEFDAGDKLTHVWQEAK